MKIFKTSMLFLMILFLGITCFAQEITLSNGEWKPYLSEHLKHYGVTSHIVSDVFASIGVKVNYKFYGDSWNRAYKDAKENTVDGTLVWSKKPERMEEMYYSDPVIFGKKDVFWHLKTMDFDWENIDDLKGLRIGGTLGYTYGELLDEAEKNGTIKIDRIADEKKNFAKLLLGRIDLFASGEVIGQEILNNEYTQEERDKITYNPKPFRIVTYHLLLNKVNPANQELMEKFNGALKQFMDSGKFDEYMKNSEEGKYEP